VRARNAKDCADSAKPDRTLHFVVVAVDGSVASAVFAPVEILQACKAIQTSLGLEQQARITWEILSPEGDSFGSSNGHRLPTDGALKTLPAQSVVFFPGFGMVTPQVLIEKLATYKFLGDWLREQYARDCVLATGCNGNFLLTEAGLMQGRPVTTSWMYAELFRKRYPDVELDLNSILLDRNHVVSVGGILCGLDLMLSVIENRVGAEVARLCAKFMLLENRRPSNVPFDQRQAVLNPDPLIRKAVDWIRSNLHRRISVDDLAARAPTSKRNLARRFRVATGESPGEYIQRVRIERAKILLETSEMQVEQIAEKVGYADTSAFARQFSSQTMMTPTEYRNRFRVRA
jgi:transcriptional regulator GlxA family with amidase domain